MKETVKTSRTAGYLEKMYRQLNTDYFGGLLEMPIITIQDTPGTYGHVTCSKVWKRRDGSAQYELNMGAATLARPIENVVATLLHEMVHIYHLQNGIQDCSRGGAYHNKKFKERAESVGLIIDYDKRIGWSITSPSDALLEYILEHEWTEIDMQRGRSFAFAPSTSGTNGKPTDDMDTPTRKPSSTRKYQCPCCGNSVRATKDIRIICADCSQMMEKCS